MDESQAPDRRRPERADASRNRTLLLVAAARLFAIHGVSAVSMDDVAAAAGVGKGTLYRRFGDKSGLAMAVLDARDRALREAIVSGPPPLGPGAGPKTRLRAFVGAYAEYLERNLDLVTLAETAAPGARYRSEAYAAWRRHVEALLEAEGTPAPDVTAELVLGLLDADLYAYLRIAHGWTPARIAESMVGAADSMARRRR
jgi:AcrR family transcriptional regulator